MSSADVGDRSPIFDFYFTQFWTLPIQNSNDTDVRLIENKYIGFYSNGVARYSNDVSYFPAGLREVMEAQNND